MNRYSNRKDRRRRSRRGRPEGRSVQIAALAAIPVISIAGGGAALTWYSGIEKQDNAYCYLREDQHVEAVFIDNSLTHQITSTQLRDYETTLSNIYESAPPNSRILIFTTALDQRGSVVRSTFDGCKPPSTPSEQAAIGAPKQTPQLLLKRGAEARETYIGHIKEMLETARDESKIAMDSPILEQLQGISRHPTYQGRSRSLTVITDGLQNSRIARFCQVENDMPPFKLFKKRNAYREVEPRGFDDVDVNFNIVEFGELPTPSLKYCTNLEVANLWRDYFVSNGAREVEVSKLRYWSGE
ncbi:MAG: hypothetical protein AAGH38_01370 [Pseudomonadota bacterium]